MMDFILHTRGLGRGVKVWHLGLAIQVIARKVREI